VYKSTCQITTDIIAEGEEQNINFQGRERVHNNHADQRLAINILGSRQRSQCNTNEKDKTHTTLEEIQTLNEEPHTLQFCPPREEQAPC
jgi:hypothetical protein